MHYYSPKSRPGARRIISVTIREVSLKLYSMEGLFSSKDIDLGTKLLLEHLLLPDEGLILDIGTGVGVIGIYALKKNPKLRALMLDINPNAVKIAKLNSRINGVEERTCFLVSNLYDKLKPNLRFSAIYSNPPLSAGWGTVEKIIIGAARHLEKNGFLQMVFYKGENRAIKEARRVFKQIKVVKRKKGYTVLVFSEPQSPEVSRASNDA